MGFLKVLPDPLTRTPNEPTVPFDIGARLKPKKKINLSFDEWNVWYLSRTEAEVSALHWPEAPRLLEDNYSVTDAVVFGSLLIAIAPCCGTPTASPSPASPSSST